MDIVALAGTHRLTHHLDDTPKLRFDRVDMVFSRPNQPPAQILKSISFDVGEGDFVCLLGPSGCGKSTILNIAAGLIEPSAGSVTAGSRVVTGPGRDRGVVFQEYALFPWLTVRDNVILGAKSGRGKVDSAKVDHFLEVTGMYEHRYKYPKELSGGMKQRAAIARTLANDPEIILMDEPFGALDPYTREALQDQLIELWSASRKTILFVTHSVEEAAYLAGTVILLKAHPGELKAVVKNEVPWPRERASEELIGIERTVRRVERT
jgi:NitT/TauT family transport system ATP-binding protein